MTGAMHTYVFPIVAAVTLLAMSPVFSYRKYPGWFIAIVYLLALPISAFLNRPTPARATWLLVSDAAMIIFTVLFRRRPHRGWP